MYRRICLSLLMLALCLCASGQDTLTVIGREIGEVEVLGVRVEQVTDTHSELSGEDLGKENIGQNLPYLLQATPSLFAVSDDGLGIGYTYFRVRGTDHTRINMTVNDVPLNDSESQTVFWVNMTDMVSSLSGVNVQRGVGTSVNGSSSFGASVNMSTEPSVSGLRGGKRSDVELRFNGGMYNTFREMLRASVCLPNNWRLDGRFSKVNSDGYLYHSGSDLWSYSGSLGYYGKRTRVILTGFGGSEHTEVAWDGVTKSDLRRDRRYNPSGLYVNDNGETVRYSNESDNYKQQHYQLSLSQRLGTNWVLKGVLHYTHGGGYSDQMKADKKYSKFGMSDYVDDSGNVVKRTDFIRKKYLNNHFYGGVLSGNYYGDHIDLSIGGALNNYVGDHWGTVYDNKYAWIDSEEYYRNRGEKLDGNVYGKLNWRVYERGRRSLSLYGDMQYRYVNYRIDGITDEDSLDSIVVRKEYHFLNPKAGITYEDHSHRVYFNFAIANREPSRKNFTESGVNALPRSERLYDYELGYSYSGRGWHAGLNLYYMDYDNQLVPTGKKSDTGATLTMNVRDSYRMGVELMGGVSMLDWFKWELSVGLSRNKIQDFRDWVTVYGSDWSESEQEVSYGDVTIALSPSVVVSNLFSFEYGGFRADIQTSAVGRQYLDNTQSKDAMLRAYSVTNVSLEYRLPLPKRVRFDVSLLMQVNNLFNMEYEGNGYSSMWINPDGSLERYTGYYAQSGVNVHGGVSFRF